MGFKVEKYEANRRFGEIVEKYGSVVDAVKSGLDCSGRGRGTLWSVEIIEGEFFVNIVQRYCGRVIVGVDAEMVYLDGVSRSCLAPVRRVLNASGLKRRIE